MKAASLSTENTLSSSEMEILTAPSKTFSDGDWIVVL